VELTAQPVERIQVEANATLMRGRITRYTDATTAITHEGTEPILTPRFTAAQRVTAEVVPALALTVASRQVGRSYLTNASDPLLVLPAHTVTDVQARLLVGRAEATLHLNNATDTRGYAGGHVSSGAALYYVLPPRNVFLQLRVLF
jgi:hypothetical protein